MANVLSPYAQFTNRVKELESNHQTPQDDVAKDVSVSTKGQAAFDRSRRAVLNYSNAGNHYDHKLGQDDVIRAMGFLRAVPELDRLYGGKRKEDVATVTVAKEDPKTELKFVKSKAQIAREQARAKARAEANAPKENHAAVVDARKSKKHHRA